MSSGDGFIGRKRFTAVELAVVVVLAALFAVVVIPVVTDKKENTPQVRAEAAVQEAVRQFHAATGTYPTFGPVAVSGQALAHPWVTGALPQRGSTPAFAGVDFDARAVRSSDGRTVTFVPDYLSRGPAHAGEAAADGIQRWRLDYTGGLSIQLDGQPY